MVGLCQELFLVRDEQREWVRVQYSVLVLVRKAGSDGLVKQRDCMVEAGWAIGRRRRGRVNHYGPAIRIL